MSKSAKVLSIASGFGIVLTTMFVALGLFWLVNLAFPGLGGGLPWPAWLIVFLMPELVFAVCTLKLWRNKRTTAVSILIPALAFAVHFATHLIGHWTN